MRATVNNVQALIDEIEAKLVEKYGADNVFVTSNIYSNDLCGNSWCNFTIDHDPLGSESFSGQTKRKLYNDLLEYRKTL